MVSFPLILSAPHPLSPLSGSLSARSSRQQFPRQISRSDAPGRDSAADAAAPRRDARPLRAAAAVGAAQTQHAAAAIAAGDLFQNHKKTTMKRMSKDE